jgi:hypothetical protein
MLVTLGCNKELAQVFGAHLHVATQHLFGGGGASESRVGQVGEEQSFRFGPERRAHAFERAHAGLRAWQRGEHGSIGTHVQHHILPEDTHLVVGATALELALHAPEPGIVAREGREEALVEQELALLRDAAGDALLQLFAFFEGRRLMEVHHGVERTQVRETAHVADEDVPAIHHQLARALEHAGQVVGVGEVLHHRVDDHQVARAVGHTLQRMRGLVQELDLLIFVGAELAADGLERMGR